MRVSAKVLAKKALTVARHCSQNHSTLTLKSLKRGYDAIFGAQCMRDFTKDSSPELNFAVRQIGGYMPGF